MLLRAKPRSLVLGFIIMMSLSANSAVAAPSSSSISRIVQYYYDNRRFMGAVLVAQHGRIIYNDGVGFANLEWRTANGPDVKYRLGSITKQFTAMVVMQLVQEGRVKLSGHLSDYLPEYRRDTGSRITIFQLLTHSSGVPSYTEIPNFMTYESRNHYPGDVFVRRYCSRNLQFTPGGQYHYSNCGYYLLGRIIERVTGKSYEDVLTERIFRRIGMLHSGYDHSAEVVSNRAAGYVQTLYGYLNAPYQDMSIPFSAGSLYSTTGDLLLWDRALNTDTFVKKKYRQQMFTAHLGGYGLGWRVGILPERDSAHRVNAEYHGGDIAGFDSMIVRLPESDSTVIILDNAQQLQSVGDLRDDIVETLLGYPPELKTPIGEVMRRAVLEHGRAYAVQLYHRLRSTAAGSYDFRQLELDYLGGTLLDAGRIHDAIAILALNVEAYPEADDAYVSLAQAYQADHKISYAIANCRKALKINPNNMQARGILEAVGR